MPHQFTLDMVPLGVATHSAATGDDVAVQCRGLVTSQDGVALTRALEASVDHLLSQIPEGARPPQSSIDHVIAVIQRNKQVTLYLNELQFVLTIQKERGRSFDAGDPIFVSDAIDVSSVRVPGLMVSDDVGVLVMVSHGWRRALFYDYGPLQPKSPIIQGYNFEARLGQVFAELMFQELLGIQDAAWLALLSQKWFPFRALPLSTIRQMVAFASEGIPIDKMMDEISKSARTIAESMLSSIVHEPVLNDHSQSIRSGLERYLAHDYVSAIHVLFARLEGVLRTLHILRSSDGRFTQVDLTRTSMASSEAERCRRSPLQPLRFMEYLERVFFAGFDPKASMLGASRNSVAHGVVSEEALSLKEATLGVLILRQLLHSIVDWKDPGQSP